MKYVYLQFDITQCFEARSARVDILLNKDFL